MARLCKFTLCQYFIISCIFTLPLFENTIIVEKCKIFKHNLYNPITENLLEKPLSPSSEKYHHVSNGF